MLSLAVCPALWHTTLTLTFDIMAIMHSQWYYAGGYEASKLDIASAEHVGLLQSLVNTMANTSGLVAVPLAAWIVERGEGPAAQPDSAEVGGWLLAGWGGVFVMVAGLYCVATVVYLRWATQEKLFL